MNKLLIRMLREIRSNFGQFISIVLIIAVGSMLMSGMFSSIEAMEESVHTYYQEQNMANLWLYYQSIPEEEIQSLLNLSEVSEAEGRYTTNEVISLNEQEVTLRFHSLTNINQPLITEGALPQGVGEVILDYKFAEANNLQIGSKFTVNTQELTVTGLCMNPEYAYKQKESGSSASVNRTFGIVYAKKETVQELISHSEAFLTNKRATKGSTTTKDKTPDDLTKQKIGYQEVLIKTDNADAVIEYAKNRSNYSNSIKLEDQPSYVNVSEALAPIRSIAYVFPLIFFFVAALVAFISLSKMVENQRMQIAVMQAIGISKAKIRVSFLFYSVMTALLGGVIFAILGNYFIPKLLIRVFINRFELPDIMVPIYWEFSMIPAVLSVVFCGIAAIIASQKVLREIPAQAMRPRLPRKSKKIVFEQISFLWNRLGYANKLILRNIFLNKSRMLLSSIGIIGSVMLIFTGLSLRNSALLVVHQNAKTLNYDYNVNYEESVKDKSLLKYDFPVEALEVTKTGKALLSQEEDMSLGYQLLEERSDLIHVFDEEDQIIPIESNSVIIPDTISRQYNIKEGDFLQIMIDDIPYTLVVTAIAKEYSASTIYICFDEAQKVGIDVDTNTVLIRAEDGVNLQESKEILVANESNKNVTTKDDVVSRSKDMLKTLNATILLILASAAILSITVIYNTTSISIFERTREYATLMVLGYHKNEVNHLTMVENIVLSIFGCLCGLPIGLQLFRYLAKLVSRENLQLPKFFDWKMALLTVGLTLVFSVMTNLFLRRKIKNIILTEALKSVE